MLDPEGVERAGMAKVEKAALEGARDVIAADVRSRGIVDLRYRIEAEDAVGKVVHTLAFADAVTVVPETD